MTYKELREKYLEFFKSKGHTIIPSASLIPAETDSSVLFTTAGMHPLVPYLLGENHPGGKRVANVQKCVRTVDIDDVGDNRHLTFFEMMGNWSFGGLPELGGNGQAGYFKKEAIDWSFEFLTDKKWLNLKPERIYVTVFKGGNGIPKDEDSIKFWQETFAKSEMKTAVAGEDEIINDDIRIIPLGVEDNFWIAGATGPCGGDTEMFYDTRPEEGKLEGKFSDLVKSGRLIEIWNNVFMEFNKKADGTVEKLKQQNVDTGMGVERTLAVLNGKENVFETELFQPVFDRIAELSQKKYDAEDTRKAFRIIADHIKAAVFMIADGIEPSNTMRGYVLRRLIRRAVRYGKLLGIENNFTVEIAKVIINLHKDFYKELVESKIFGELEKEESKFRNVISEGIKISEKIFANKQPIIAEKYSKIMQVGDKKEIFRKLYRDKKYNDDFGISLTLEEIMGATLTGKEAFDLYQSFGFPIELIVELVQEKFLFVDIESFYAELQKHQELSRTAAVGAFKGGLADSGEQTTKLHTATHLLLAALREVLGPEIYQKGSNITVERLRFDFNYPQKMTAEQIKKVEDLVNKKINEGINVEMLEMPKAEALKISRTSFDPSKYGDIVKVYKIGDFSVELCGGPHVKNISELGHFKIVKEESSSAGLRRIKAIVE